VKGWRNYVKNLLRTWLFALMIMLMMGCGTSRAVIPNGPNYYGLVKVDWPTGRQYYLPSNWRQMPKEEVDGLISMGWFIHAVKELND